MKIKKNFLWVLICGLDINRDNIPFGSLNVCIPDKIDDETMAKSVRLSVDGTNDLYLIGRGGACSSRNVGHRRTSVYGCTSIDRSIKPSLVREGGDHGATRS